MTMVIVIAGSRLKVAQKIAVPTVLMTNLEPTHGQPIKVLICIRTGLPAVFPRLIRQWQHL